MYELTVEGNFAAAHQLRGYEGSCEKLHGHNWRVQLTVRAGRLNQIGLAIDFKLLKKRLGIYLAQLDHTNLNELEIFQRQNPSSENIARWLCRQLGRDDALAGVKIGRVTVWESEHSCASYLPEETSG